MFKDWWHKFVWGETIEETKIRFDKIRKEEKCKEDGLDEIRNKIKRINEGLNIDETLQNTKMDKQPSLYISDHRYLRTQPPEKLSILTIFGLHYPSK